MTESNTEPKIGDSMPEHPHIDDLGMQDVRRMLSLNNAHAVETSLLDLSGLAALLKSAFYARGIDRGATAVLIALDHNADYTSPNFLWFKRRVESFIYIDRVIVAPDARGRGLARRLYIDLFSHVRQKTAHRRIFCEVNIHAPNPASEAFHAAMGFAAIGKASIHNDTKRVRYLQKTL